MTQEEVIQVPKWFLENVEDTLRIQNNINLDEGTGETCQDRNVRESLNGLRKLLSGEELTGRERLEKLHPELPISESQGLDEAAEEHMNNIAFYNELDKIQCIRDFKAGAKWMEQKEKSYSPWLSIKCLKDAAIDFGEFAKAYEIGGQSYEEDMAVAFTRGAEWMAEQGETKEIVVERPLLGPPMICCPVNANNGDKVIVQIRKED